MVEGLIWPYEELLRRAQSREKGYTTAEVIEYLKKL